MSEKLYFDGLFLSKAYNVSAKKLQKNYVSLHVKTPDSWLEKWHKEFGWFSCEQLKVLRFALWWAPFPQSIKRFISESTEDLCLMTVKSDAKFEEKLTLGS